MSLARNQRRLDRRAARMPVPPARDPDGSVLHNQVLHLIRSSTCSDHMKLSVLVQVLATAAVLTAFPGDEAAQAEILADRLKEAVEAVAKARGEAAA